MVAGEEDGLEWMNELLCGGEAATGEEGGARTIQLAGIRRSDSDEDRDTQLEDLVDMRTCGALAVYLGVIILVLLIACTLIVTQRFYAGDVVLCCIIALYELSVMQIVVLAVARRRSHMVAAAGEQTAGTAVSTGDDTIAEEDPTSPSGDDVASAPDGRDGGMNNIAVPIAVGEP